MKQKNKKLVIKYKKNKELQENLIKKINWFNDYILKNNGFLPII